MSFLKEGGDRGKDRERGARPKVRQSRSEERRHTGGQRKVAKKKGHSNQRSELDAERPVSDGFQYGDVFGCHGSGDRGTSSLLKEGGRWPSLDPGKGAGEVAEARGASGSRTLRQKIQDAVGQCFPIKTHSVVATAAPPPLLTPSSPNPSPGPSPSLGPASSRRKIHLSELMLDDCPFPAGSELAQKWNLIKQHTAPLTQPPSLDSGGADSPAPEATAPPPAEDVDDRLRERRRISIEQGVEPPPDAEIHTFEVRAQVNPLYKLGPKLAHGMSELAGEDTGASAALQQLQHQHALLLQSCLATLDEAVASAPTGSADPAAADADVPLSQTPPQSTGTPPKTERPKSQDGYRIHTQIDYIHCLVPDLLQVTNLPCYWGVMDRYQAEALLEGKPEGTFLLRDSAQEDYLFSVSFRRYSRSLHARIEQWNHNFSFDVHDPSVFHAPTVTGLLEHYKDPSSCMFFEPLLSNPSHRTHPFSLQHVCRAVISKHTTYDGINVLPIPNALKKYLKEYHYKQRVRVRRMDTWWE